MNTMMLGFDPLASVTIPAPLVPFDTDSLPSPNDGMNAQRLTSSQRDEWALVTGAPRTCAVAVGPARAGRFRRLQLQKSGPVPPTARTWSAGRQSSALVIAPDDAA